MMIAPVKAIKQYNTSILNLFEIILGLNEGQQKLLLKLAENLFIKEKRANDRKSCHIPIYFATSDRVYSSHIENISPTGLFIKTEKLLPIGEEILMTFKINGINKPLKVNGEIVHTKKTGIGVRFKNLSTQDADTLEHIVGRLPE